MVGIRPQTPGTIVVLVGTILLIIVSVSVPILKSIYFLKASVSATVDSTNVTSGQITMGMWGYCVGSTCSNVTLGYTLTNIDELFGISGLAADIPVDIPTTLIKWLTYVLVLHPIAAGFAVIATVCGLLAHIREFAITGFTTCFAGFASFFALVAFIFDIVLFEIAKKRIIAAGGTASLGNAIWMTLVAMLCLMFSGCFFGLGRCLVRNRQPRREASEKNKPQPDAQYGNSMRQDALGGGYGQGQGEYEQGFGQAPMYGQGAPSQSSKTGSLPAFQEFGDRDGEIIPLTSVRPDYDDDDEHVGYRDETRTEAASLVSGVGMGYGRRTDQGTPVPIRPDSQVYSSQQSLPPPPRRNTSVSNSTVSPFVGMSQAGPEQSAYAFAPPSSPPPNVAGAGGYRTPGRSPPPQNAYAAPLPPVDYAGPPPAVAFAGTSYPQDKGATAYTAYPPPPSQSGTASYYGSPPPQQQYFSPPPQQQYSSPPPQQQYSSPPPPQQYYAQNPSQDSHYAPPASIAPSYSTHPPQEASASAFGGAAVAGGSQYAYGAGQGGLDQYGFPVQQQVEHQQLPSGHNPYDQRSPYDQ